MSNQIQNLKKIEERIEAALKKSGRGKDEVQLIWVSKNHPLEAVIEARGLDAKHFGENRVQEAMTKFENKPSDEVLHIIEQIKNSKTPKLFAFNKCDLIKDKKNLLPILQEMQEKYADIFDDFLLLSAEKNQGTDDILNKIKGYLPDSPFLFPEDHLTDLPMRLIASEQTREKSFMLLKNEIPYSVMVETLEYKVNPDNGDVRIEQVILLEREAHKKIVVGHKGAMIKQIGQASRRELEKFLGVKVHLFLRVKVQQNWAIDNFYYKMFGLEKPKESKFNKKK